MPRVKKSNPFSTIRKEFGAEGYGLKQFRKDVAKLKKKGLVSKQVDARSQQATRYMTNLIRKYRDVLEGHATTLHIPPNEREYYKSSGHRVHNSRAVVETRHGETVRKLKTKDGIPRYSVTQQTPTGKKTATRELLPYTHLEGRITQIVNSARPLKKGEYYGFRFFGNNSIRYFTDKQRLLDYFLAYQSVEMAIRKGDVEQEQEIYANFEVVKIENVKQWEREIVEQRQRSRSERELANRERLNAWRRHRYAQMDELEKRERNERRRISKSADAERKRVSRETIKNSDPEKYKRELEAGKLRMQKSRAAKKEKK